MIVAAVIDSSVWIPYLRVRRFASSVDPLVARGRAWLHGIVLMELHAGAATRDDRRDVDLIHDAARRLDLVVQPERDDFRLAGVVLADHARRHGRVRPRDHSHDLLITIGAARSCGVVLTKNAADMERWARALSKRKFRVRVAVPADD